MKFRRLKTAHLLTLTANTSTDFRDVPGCRKEAISPTEDAAPHLLQAALFARFSLSVPHRTRRNAAFRGLPEDAPP